MKRRLLIILLTLCMVVTMLPMEALAYFVPDVEHADSSYTGDITIANENGGTDVLEYDASWEELYPYGAFVFGNHEVAAGEDSADGGNVVTIPVYRLGGTEGRATVYVRYQPVISQDGENSLTYSYAASGRDDMTIQVENPQPVAQYQPLGISRIYAGCELNVEQGITTVVDEETGEETHEEADYQVLSLTLDEQAEVDDYVWQFQIVGVTEDGELSISQSWTDIADAVGPQLEVPDNIWYADDALYDFRCLYTVDGKTYCTATALEVPFEETTEELEEMPADLELNAEPTYTTLTFDGEYDVCDFELTFAEGEWVKNIIVTVTDDDTPELPEMGLFTLTGNEGGEIYQLAATMTLLINDNDPFEPSQLGFTVSEVSADQDSGSVTVTVQRTGGMSYPVSVDYEAVSGTAQVGKQFSGVSGTLMFAGDVDSIDIQIPLIAEAERAEPLEFKVQLSNLQGGGQEGLCTLGEGAVAVTLTSAGKTVGLGAGLNLASVLATASGEDISASGYVDAPLLPGSTTVTGTQDTSVPTPITGTYTESSNGRTYAYASGVQLRRSSSNYAANYWSDWENAVGTKYGDSSGTMNYWNSFTAPTFVDSSATVESGDTKKLFEKSQSEINLEHNNTAAPGSILDIEDAGMLFSKVEWQFEMWQLGIARAGRKSENYLYVMPYCFFKPGSDQATVWNGNVGKITDGAFSDWDVYWSSSLDLSIDSGDLRALIGLSLNKNEKTESAGGSVIGTGDYSKGANGTTQLDLTRLSLQRRTFSNTSTLGLKIHTANDADSGLGMPYAQLDESLGVYDEMEPTVSLVAKQSGVDENGNLYVGSKLEINLNNTESYAALVGESYKYSVYLTDADGNVKNAGVECGTGNTYYLTMKWSGMTDADLTKAYTINIVMERQQTIELDISNSLPDGASEDEIADMWDDMWDKKKNITYSYSETNTTDKGLTSTPKHYSFQADRVAALAGSDTAMTRNLCYGTKKDTTFCNLQSINFNLGSEDIILFNGRSYAGNETIYLSVADLATGTLKFLYYNKDALSMPKPMVASILETALYYDTNGNGRIDGYYDAQIGYFVLDEAAGDLMLGFIDGEFDETTFRPVVDSDGTVHQYFLKAYYTMNPRSYQAPAGASSSDTAMVLPLLMSTITNATAFSKLSTQQQGYRYLQAGDSRTSADGVYTDSSCGKLMYGAAATARSYVDIPLGGDTSPASYTMQGDKKVYTWTPDYRGNLLVDFDELQPIYNDENITGETVAIAGEEPHWVMRSMADPGTLTFTEAGAQKLNGYLGSLTANTTFGLAVQETTDITSIYSIAPESVTEGNVKAIPNGDYLANMEGTGSPDSASGGSGGNSAMPEFESDLGITLPSTEFELGDYASIIMDGYSVGFSIGLPILSTSSYQDDGATDPPGLGDRVKEANEGMSTLRDFMSSVAKRDGTEAFKQMMKDSYNEAMKGQGIKSKDFSVSFSVALAILFEYNPIDNTYYFKQASIAANAGLEFTLQYRFTPVPILYVYLKTGFEVGLTTGLSVERTAKEGKSISGSNWLGASTVKGFGVSLQPGESACFTLNMQQTRGFHMNMAGNVYMEVLADYQKEIYKQDPANYAENIKNKYPLYPCYVSAGRLSSDGSEPVEVFLPDTNSTVYVIVTALEPTYIYSATEVSGAKSLVYWNGINFSPSGFLEVGAGIGVELLKFELYLKAQMGLSFTIGGYSEDAGSYRGAQLNNFDLALSLGFNVTVLFFNYSMDLIGYYLHIENTGAGTTTVESKWGALSQATGGDTGKSVGGYGGGSLVSVSAPTDTSGTQRVVGDGAVSRAYNPTDDKAPFQLSGYGTSGDGFKLMDGLSAANSYQVFRVGSDNYLLYTQSRSGAANAVDTPQLVLSRLVLTGSDNAARLQNPANSSETYLAVDNDATGDLDYSYSVNGNTLTVVWTSYDSASGADEVLTAVDMAERTVVKTASIDLSAASPSFTTPTVVSGADSTFRFLPQQEGNVSIYAESEGSGESGNTLLKDYLKAVYGLTDMEITNGAPSVPDHATALYRWNYQSDLNDMYGSGSKLTAYTGSGTTVSASLGTGEVIENLETATVGDRLYVAYSTVQYAYFKNGTTVNTADENSDLAAIKRLYLRSFDGTTGWGEAKLLRTAIDFDRCSSNGAYSMSDGVYSGGLLTEAQIDPYFSNLKLLRADLSGGNGAETVLLYEMGGNTYLIRESSLTSAVDGGGFTATPIFAQSEGTDAVIGADSEGNLAVVYTAPMTASGSNALYVAWWDGNLGTWGSGNVLAMNHLQVFEDGTKYGLTDEELEKAYLGQETDNADYNAYLASLPNDARESAKGAMEQLRFHNLQITLAQTTSETNGSTSEQLLVLTQGSLQKLRSETLTNLADTCGAPVKTVLPDGDADMGFYAVSFGAGKQGIGQANLSLTDYNFTAGTKLSGTLTFTNTGTVAIRASSSEPATVTLSAAHSSGYSQTIATWYITESVPAGASVELPFRMTSALTADLPEGTVFSAYVTEDDAYISASGGTAFTATTGALLTVESKPELQVESFSATLTGVSGDQAILALDMVVSNRGSVDATNTFVQLAYEAVSGSTTTYLPLNLTDSVVTVNEQEPVQERGVTGSSLDRGIIYTDVIKSGYQRRIHGTLHVPLNSFRQDTLSGLHLKAEVFSDADNTSLNGSLYTSSHSGEYCASNNVWKEEIAQKTFFSAPKQISMAMGNTLRMPISFVSTSATGAEIVVREIGDGTESWTANLGILYFGDQTIVAAPGADTAGKTGIIQVEDLTTNSIYAITYRITELGSGINIYKDDESFTFYEANGTLTDVTSKNQDWRFNADVPGWDGGETAGEVPMNNDTVIAMKDGAYLTFKTVADTITLWFDGEVTISSTLASATTVTAESDELRKTQGDYPLVIDFGNDAGTIHTVTIRAKSGTVLDRYQATYSENAEPVRTDESAPQIFWSRSFPDTASLENGESVTLTCYVTDDSQLVQVTGMPVGTTVKETSERFWFFPLTITKNELITIRATDASGKTTVYPLRVDWFNTQVSVGAVATAPDFSKDHITVQTEDGKTVTGPLAQQVYPYIRSSYVLKEGETITVSPSGSATAITAESDGRWKLTENGVYMVRVTAADGTWSQVVLPMDWIDDGTFTLSVTDDPAQRRLLVSVGGKNELVELTVNGANIMGTGGTFAYTLGGTYTVFAKNSVGRTISGTVTVSVPLTIDNSAVTTEICTVYGKADGKVSLDLAGIHGGGYDPDASQPAQNSYQAVYQAALLPVAGETAEPDAAAVEAANWTSASNGTFLFQDLATGWYQLLIRDSQGNAIHQNVFVDTQPPAALPPASGHYEIVVAETEHGTVTADPQRARQGQQVSVIATPDSGYVLKNLAVTDRNGNALQLTRQGDGSYTFTMPGFEVIIWASFIGNNPFTDISESDWFYENVVYVYMNGLMNGTSDTTFSPYMTTTRGMIVTILYRLEGEPAVSGDCSFDDVASGAYYEKAILWAAGNGIVGGYGNGSFGPDDSITREQMATILYRYAQYKKRDDSVGKDTNILSYNDALDVSGYAFDAMQWVCGAGIMQGSDGNLMPQGNATRAQAAAILHRFCENILK